MNHTSEDDGDEKEKEDERYTIFVKASKILADTNFEPQ